jgi:hypothetical protein
MKYILSLIILIAGFGVRADPASITFTISPSPTPDVTYNIYKVGNDEPVITNLVSTTYVWKTDLPIGNHEFYATSEKSGFESIETVKASYTMRPKPPMGLRIE